MSKVTTKYYSCAGSAEFRVKGVIPPAEMKLFSSAANTQGTPSDLVPKVS